MLCNLWFIRSSYYNWVLKVFFLYLSSWKVHRIGDPLLESLWELCERCWYLGLSLRSDLLWTITVERPTNPDLAVLSIQSKSSSCFYSRHSVLEWYCFCCCAWCSMLLRGLCWWWCRRRKLSLILQCNYFSFKFLSCPHMTYYNCIILCCMWATQSILYVFAF